MENRKKYSPSPHTHTRTQQAEPVLGSEQAIEMYIEATRWLSEKLKLN